MSTKNSYSFLRLGDTSQSELRRFPLWSINLQKFHFVTTTTISVITQRLPSQSHALKSFFLEICENFLRSLKEAEHHVEVLSAPKKIP